jgi:hypothetical protein
VYMSGITFFDSYEEAAKAFRPNGVFSRLERHKDGAGAIVTLQHKPVQYGQCEYDPKGSRYEIGPSG